MTDCILMVDGFIRDVWRGKAKEQLPPMTPELFDSVIEVESGTVDINATWDGEQFVPPSPPRVVVGYAEFRARFTDAEIEALFNLMKTSWRIDDYVGLARAQNAVTVTGDAAAAARQLLIDEGVLTPERADVIFS